MDKKFLLGGGAIAGVVVVAAIAIALISGNSINPEERTVQDERNSANREVNLELADESKIDGLLSDYVFYKGNATVFEKQSWKSLYQDNTSGVGDAILSSEEIIVYDGNTEKTYIVARYMAYESQHVITVNDMHGDYIDTGNVSGSGNLTEYYGRGFLKEIEIEGASASVNKKYTLDFSNNPVRMDNKNSTIYTNPLPLRSEWVIYTSTGDTTRLGGARIFAPEDTTNSVVNLVPEIANINQSRGYNASETYTYEATDRIFVPVGTFSYDYKKMTYEEVREVIDDLRDDANSEEAYKEMAKNQPPAWKETASFADSIAVASASAAELLNSSGATASGDFKDIIQVDTAVDSISKNPMIEGGAASLINETEDISSAKGSTRKLEDFVLDTSNDKNGGAEQKKLNDELTLFIPLFKEVIADYKASQKSLQENLNEIKSYSNMEINRPEDKMRVVLVEYYDNIALLKNANNYLNLLLTDFEIVLTELNMKTDTNIEFSYSELNKVYQLWTETLKTYQSSKGKSLKVDVVSGVSLPKGYPSDVIKIIDGSIVTIAEVIKDEDANKDGYSLTLKTDLTIEEALMFYKNYLKNVPGVSTFSFGEVSTITGTKGGYDFSIMIMKNNFGGSEKSAVQIVLIPISE